MVGQETQEPRASGLTFQLPGAWSWSPGHQNWKTDSFCVPQATFGLTRGLIHGHSPYPDLAGTQRSHLPPVQVSNLQRHYQDPRLAPYSASLFSGPTGRSNHRVTSVNKDLCFPTFPSWLSDTEAKHPRSELAKSTRLASPCCPPCTSQLFPSDYGLKPQSYVAQEGKDGKASGPVKIM